MLFFFVITMLYGIPIFFGILIIYWMLSRMKYPKARMIRNLLLTGLGIFLIGTTFYSWRSRQHIVYFELSSRYIIALHITEIESFQDAPTEFIAEVTNLKTGRKRELRFSLSEGSAFDFAVSETNPHLIHITGLGRNAGLHYTINMDKGRKTIYPDTGHVYRQRL